jgi:hypothetical protein
MYTIYHACKYNVLHRLHNFVLRCVTVYITVTCFELHAAIFILFKINYVSCATICPIYQDHMDQLAKILYYGMFCFSTLGSIFG